MISLLALGCGGGCADAGGSTEQVTAAKVKPLALKQVVALQEAKKFTLVDANECASREQGGTIPGAILLREAGSVSAGKLPRNKDTPLVFYCWTDT